MRWYPGGSRHREGSLGGEGDRTGDGVAADRGFRRARERRMGRGTRADGGAARARGGTAAGVPDE
eukprot:2490868-Pleurochrysis_carterae.AAC.1